ncbi:MAG: MFS transporter [Geminicoccaceae bacterium]
MSLPANWRELAAIMGTATVVGVTISLTLPLLSLILEREGYGPFTIGVNSAANGLGIFAVAPFMPRLTERLGAVGCFRLALVVCAGVLLLFPLWIQPAWWFVLRFVFGCAAATMFVLSEAAVNALIEEHLRGRVLAIYASLFSVGFAAGPALLVVFGTEGWTPFLAAAGLFLLALLPTGLLAAVERNLEEQGKAHGLKLTHIWHLAPLPLLGVFIYAFLESAHFALLPVYALALGFGVRDAAGLLSIWLIGNVILQFPVGWLADRYPRRAVLAACAGVAGLGLLAMKAAGAESWLYPVLVLAGGTMGSLYTLTLTLMGERFKGAELTVANTAFVMTFQMGAIAGPPVVGAAMTTVGEPSFPIVLLPAVLLLAGAAWRSLRSAQLAMAARNP